MLQQLTTESSLRLIIATGAFRIEIGCPDVRQLIHWGVPEDAETYIQESERDGKSAIALIMKNASDGSMNFTSRVVTPKKIVGSKPSLVCQVQTLNVSSVWSYDPFSLNQATWKLHNHKTIYYF